MTFSEYAQMLYPLIGEGQNTSDFVLTLSHQIMAEPLIDKDKQKMEQNVYYPLDHLSPDMLGRIYNGSKEMSMKAAGAIQARLDKERFIGYLSEFTPDAIEKIDMTLRKSRLLIEDKDAIETCTNIFVSLLEECARRKRKPKSTKKDATLDNTKNEEVSQLPFPSHEPEPERISGNCSVGKESSMPTLSPSEQALLVFVTDGGATPMNDEVENMSSNIETPITLNQTELPDISNEITSNIDVISDQQSIISNSDKTEDTSINTEANGTLDETVSSGINNEQKSLADNVADEMSDNDASDDSSLNNETDFRMDSGGAHLSIPDEYRRCAFCTDWKGNASDAYNSKTGARGMCTLYNRVQRSTDGVNCKDYEPNEVRIAKQMLSSQ